MWHDELYSQYQATSCGYLEGEEARLRSSLMQDVLVSKVLLCQVYYEWRFVKVYLEWPEGSRSVTSM